VAFEASESLALKMAFDGFILRIFFQMFNSSQLEMNHVIQQSTESELKKYLTLFEKMPEK
jgi:hypothetical protein